MKVASPHRRDGHASEVIPFLTMELLEGQTLGARIHRAGPLAPADAARVLCEVAVGLSAVHQAGIVHRDFKTENVFLVGGERDAERAVVMDFGLARPLVRDRVSARSSARGLIGTVAYMAPEQVEGQTATAASDTYAFGIVAFEVLTGELPFVGDSPLAVATLRLRQEPPRPSNLRAELDAEWDVLIGRCLSREPKRGFASVEELLVALRGLEPTKGDRGPATPTPGFRVAAAGAVVIIAVAALAILGITSPRVSSAPAATTAPISPNRIDAPAMTPTAVPVSPASSAVGASPRPPLVPSRVTRRRSVRAHPPAGAPSPSDDDLIDPFAGGPVSAPR